MTTTQLDTVPARLDALMHRLGMSKSDAARYLGVPQQTLANWLTGARQPNAVALRLLDVLGLVEALAPSLHREMIPAKPEGRWPTRPVEAVEQTEGYDDTPEDAEAPSWASGDRE